MGIIPGHYRQEILIVELVTQMLFVRVCVRGVCVCVCEREREKEREKDLERRLCHS